MRVLLTGSTGFIGRALAPALQAAGWQVVPLARGRGLPPPSWDIGAGRFEPGDGPAPDAVVHLAGENIAARRWSAAQKRRLLDSRLRGTALLLDGLQRWGARPQVMLFASAVGYYGDRGDEELDEDAPPGEGFAADLCRQLEQAAEQARELASRVVAMRLGVVLARGGGALGRMWLPFSLGLGGRVGDGRQSMSWISRRDAVAAMAFLLDAGCPLDGPVNLTAPNPVRNAEFAHALARAMRRPALLPMPAAVVRLLFGQMGQELLLAGARVLPRRLRDAGFRFRDPTLPDALEAVMRGQA